MEKSENENLIASKPEDLIFEACYAPVQLDRMLESAEGRSRVRRLTVPQLYYGIRRLSGDQLLNLLPHITEEQWQGIVDLDIWNRDVPDAGRFLEWERNIILSSDPVARKLIRAVDPELWMLSFRLHLDVVPHSEEDRIASPETGRDWMDTPDGFFRVFFPDDSEPAQFLRELVTRLYALDSAKAAALLADSFATAVELEEECYRNRRRRIEELGFRDYFDSIDIYTPLRLDAKLPEKELAVRVDISALPIGTRVETGSLLLQALSRTDDLEVAQVLLEELFFVTNKLLSADQVSPAELDRVKRGIRKVLAGVNLGLDYWSGGNLARALEGSRRYYLQSFFQIGFGQLMRLRKWADRIPGRCAEEGSLEERLLALLKSSYPRMVEVVDDKAVTRFFETRDDVERIEAILRGLELYI